MSNKTDKELLDAIETRKRLESYGYKRRCCRVCWGSGIAHEIWRVHCKTCGGKGYTWEAPMR